MFVWSDLWQMTLQSYFLNHIDVIPEEAGLKWRFTSLYGVVKRHEQESNLGSDEEIEESVPYSLDMHG